MVFSVLGARVSGREKRDTEYLASLYHKVKSGAIHRATKENGYDGYEVVRNGWNGLLATSAGSAKRGIWHRVQRHTPLGEALVPFHFQERNMEIVETIDATFHDGGRICRHQTANGRGYRLFCDGSRMVSRKGELVVEHHNQYHIGCQEEPDEVHVAGGTFVVEVYMRQTMSGSWSKAIKRVVKTRDCNDDRILEIVRRL